MRDSERWVDSVLMPKNSVGWGELREAQHLHGTTCNRWGSFLTPTYTVSNHRKIPESVGWAKERSDVPNVELR